MKFLLATLLIILSLQLQATEIQCKTSLEGIDIAIKKSPDTGRYYLLIFQGEGVNPVPLKSDSIQETKALFHYEDEVLTLKIDREKKEGTLLVINEAPILLTSCKDFDLTF